MSNALALAAITAALKELLEGVLPDSSIIDGTAKVTATAPDIVKTDGQDDPSLNLFLYQVTPNPGWANAGLPARDARGERTAVPPLALDLHYLLTAYAKKDFHAEIILGYAMQRLHECPILARETLREMQDKWRDGDALGRALATSNLAEQVEGIKICPERIGVEGLSNLWTAFQANYRPTAAYLVSVALIESTLPARSALPVLRRGPEDRGAVVPPDLTPPFPTLVAVMPPNQQPSVRLGETLILSGFRLDGEPGDRIHVMAKHPRMPAAADLELQGVPTAAEIRARVPNDDPGRFPAGNYVLTVGYSQEDKLYRTTNQLPISLAPALAERPGAKRVKGHIRLEVTCTPHVWQGQRASLLLNDREVIAEPFGEKADTLTFTFEGIPAGEYWVRLRVDGVESLLVNRAVTPPAFDLTQKVTLP